MSAISILSTTSAHVRANLKRRKCVLSIYRQYADVPLLNPNRTPLADRPVLTGEQLAQREVNLKKSLELFLLYADESLQCLS